MTGVVKNEENEEKNQGIYLLPHYERRLLLLWQLRHLRQLGHHGEAHAVDARLKFILFVLKK